MCDDFPAYTPRLAEVRRALRNQDAPRLREAAHKLCGLLSAFSTAAGEVASDLEDHAVLGQLDEARHLVGRVEGMATQLVGEIDDVSYESCASERKPPTDTNRPTEADATGDARTTGGTTPRVPSTSPRRPWPGAGPLMQPITRLQDLDDRARGHVGPGNLRHRLMHMGIERLVQGDQRGDAESAEDSHQLRLDHGHAPGHRPLILLLRSGVQCTLQVVQGRQQLQGERGQA